MGRIPEGFKKVPGGYRESISRSDLDEKKSEKVRLAAEAKAAAAEAKAAAQSAKKNPLPGNSLLVQPSAYKVNLSKEAKNLIPQPAIQESLIEEPQPNNQPPAAAPPQDPAEMREKARALLQGSVLSPDQKKVLGEILSKEK